MDANEIIRIISESKKRTPARALLKGDIQNTDLSIHSLQTLFFGPD
jgi:hypothetical protein